MISQTTPDGSSPASRARSTAASVCPMRSRTPPGFARNGNTCPGCTRSCGVESGWIATWIVRLRSAAEMPVVTPSRASTLTVNAVPSGASLWSVIGRRPRWSARSSVRHRQISPRAWVAMKLIASGVANCAAIVGRPRSRGRDRRRRRPSGPRGCPRSLPRSSRTGVVTAIRRRLAGEQLLDVLREHVGLEIDARPPARARRASSRSSVCGISATAKPAASTAATVRLVPWTAIEPFSTT